MAIQSYIVEMLYYLILFLSVLLASSFLIIVFVALLRIVVNQQYPPLTKEYLSAEIVEGICLCFVIVSALFGWIPSDLQRKYLSNSSETLHIIIVPGYEMNRFSSMFLQKYLEARGHRVWAINNIFFADNLAQIIDTTRECVLEICRQNELTEKIHLIGHSMGGSIATLLCGVGAISAHALILIEGLGPAHEPPHAAFARYQTHLEQRRKPRKAKPMASVEEAAARIQRLNPKLSNDRARQFAKYITKESEDGLVWAWDPRHRDKAPIGYDAARYQHVFQKLQLPTHLIWGAESWYLTLPDLQSRIDCLPNIHSQHTLNTGHSPHYEQPAVLAETLLACLGRNS